MRPLEIRTSPDSLSAVAQNAAMAAESNNDTIETLSDIDGRRFATVLATLKPFLLRVSRSLSCSPEDAEDLVQDSIIKAWLARDSFVRGSNLQAWLCTIMRNRFYSLRRHERVQTSTLAAFAESYSFPYVTPQPELDLRLIVWAISLLPDTQWEAMILVGVCGFGYQETAVLTNTSVGTIKSRVSRARDALRHTLDMRKNCYCARMSDSALRQWLGQVEAFRLLALALLRARLAGNLGPALRYEHAASQRG